MIPLPPTMRTIRRRAVFYRMFGRAYDLEKLSEYRKAERAEFARRIRALRADPQNLVNAYQWYGDRLKDETLRQAAIGRAILLASRLL